MRIVQEALNAVRRKMGKVEVFTFDGGIHPDDMKEQTKDKVIVDINVPKEMVFPLQQHIGAPAKPCVTVGNRVLAGQKVGEADGFVSANIHSSVSGTVVAIEPRLHPAGFLVNSVVVENDGLDEWVKLGAPRTVEEVEPSEIVELVREAGITGMGGAAFPAHVKLSPPADKKIEYVIVNGAECEPYLTSDYCVMLEQGKEVIDGLRIVMKLFGLDTGYIAIETNKPKAIAKITELAKSVEDVTIKVVGVKTKYPQGSEKHLIKAVTGRSIPPGKLPMDVGAIVNNVDTVKAIERAVLRGIPLTSRVVTVAGDAVSNPCNLRVPIGTSFDALVEECGGLLKPAAKCVMGGPMMGLALVDTKVPVIKGSSGLLVFGEEAAKSRPEQSCLRCGKCVSGCPMNLLPNMVKEAVCCDDMEKLLKLNINDCIQCGSCTYVCPAEQNPLQYIRTGKAKLRKAEVKG